MFEPMMPGKQEKKKKKCRLKVEDCSERKEKDGAKAKRQIEI
jgi:hypothetical protein